MKNLLLLLSIAALTSCIPDRYFESNKLPLRQLINTKEPTKTAKGSFFLIKASYSEKEEYKQTIKMYALVNGSYKYLEYDIKNVRIKLEDSITTPYLKIQGVFNEERLPKNLDEYLTNDNYHTTHSKIITIHTPEKYLPEYLIPIKLTK